MSTVRPIKVLVGALGGQGGGVICDWLVHVAHEEGYLIQTTSVPGVAQRTGATVYYLELFPCSELPADGRRPLFALMPQPGDVDVLLSSELMEAGRALQRGVVTADRTAVITSTHRVYGISERMAMADGRADSDEMIELVRSNSRRFIGFDLQAVADASNSVISAAMFGALAGSGELPFTRRAYEKSIEAGGIAIQQSLAAFARAFDIASQPGGVLRAMGPAEPATRSEPYPPLPTSLLAAIQRFAEPVRDVVELGVRRLVDYQDVAYAHAYLERLQQFANQGAEPLMTVARCLALWMSFEDTIRVADLKIRTARNRRVREEVRAATGQIVYVTEFMSPRLEEICGTLPAWLGRWVLRTPAVSRWIARRLGGREIATSKLSCFLLLYFLAARRGSRRGTLRFEEEAERIGKWLKLVEAIARTDVALAREVAECQQLVKGYGDTHERGLRNIACVLDGVEATAGMPGSADRLRNLRLAALADDEGVALAKAIAA